MLKKIFLCRNIIRKIIYVTEINQQMLNHVQVNNHSIDGQLKVPEKFYPENICRSLLMIDRKYLNIKQESL
jgi:hypothetical protein